jgi:hypothetical protein
MPRFTHTARRLLTAAAALAALAPATAQAEQRTPPPFPTLPKFDLGAQTVREAQIGGYNLTLPCAPHYGGCEYRLSTENGTAKAGQDYGHGHAFGGDSRYLQPGETWTPQFRVPVMRDDDCEKAETLHVRLDLRFKTPGTMKPEESATYRSTITIPANGCGRVNKNATKKVKLFSVTPKTAPAAPPATTAPAPAAPEQPAGAATSATAPAPAPAAQPKQPSPATTTVADAPALDASTAHAEKGPSIQTAPPVVERPRIEAISGFGA